MKILRFIKNFINETWQEDHREDFYSFHYTTLPGFLFCYLVAPAIVYFLLFVFFDSHRLSFFIGLPLGFALNFIVRDLPIYVFKIVLILFWLVAVPGMVITLLTGFFIVLYVLLTWIWRNLPS